jgi:BTB/POZ domain
MSFEYPQEIINDYEKLLESGEEYDVIIYVGEDEDVEEIHAHSNILRIRSQYFRTALSNELTKRKDGKFTFKKNNISPQFFEIILR